MKNKIVVVLFLVSCLFGCDQKTTHKKTNNRKLPYLSVSRDTSFYKNGKKNDSIIYNKTPSFNLINQDGKTIDEGFTTNKIILAEFFFTSCPSICPLVSKQLKRVYTTYKEVNDLLILSHTIHTEYDTPEVLKEYSDRLGVDTDNWQFLTGDKNQIYDLANFGYRTTVYNDPKIKGVKGLMHSGAIVLVDKNKIIRGIYDGKDKLSVNSLIKDIATLLQVL